MNRESYQTTQADSDPTPERFNDHELADWLDRCLGTDCLVGYFQADYLCKVVDLSLPDNVLYVADPEKEAKKQLKKLARKGRLRYFALPLADLGMAQIVNPVWHPNPINEDAVNNLIDTRQVILGRVEGRGPHITSQTAQKVWSDAGARCMFEGCAEDLTHVPFYSGAARVGYLAHIIASDPRGPRGSVAASHLRANDPENVMLLCDKHHRLIDSFAPGDFPAAVLNAMRQRHRDRVSHFLDSMRFPRVKAITLHANLAGVPTYFQESDLMKAILANKKAMVPGVISGLRRTVQRDERNSPGFWGNYLREHENQIRQMVATFNDPSSFESDELAVFPLHHVAMLVLAGRIMGEARTINVFQYHRQLTSWAWDPAAEPLPIGTIRINALPVAQVNEVLITIEMTANFDENAMPDSLAASIADGSMPWIRILMQTPHFDCINHPADIVQFMDVSRRMINHVQDVMRVREVHMIAISPASTVFSFGRMLQAGHHPKYTIYDRAGREDKFVRAMSISGHDISADCNNGQPFSIPLR